MASNAGNRDGWISTGKDNASAVPSPIEKADATHKRVLFGHAEKVVFSR
jgi:hypothetical protein